MAPSEKDQGRDLSHRMELVLAVFDDEREANKLGEHMKQWIEDGVGVVERAAVIVKDAHGRTRLQDMDHVDQRDGSIFERIARTLLGLLAGSTGSVVGALAGVGAGLSAEDLQAGFRAQGIDAIENGLARRSSAYVATVEQTWAAQLFEELERAGSQVGRYALPAPLTERLRAKSQNRRQGE